MIKALINTTQAERFGTSAQRTPIHGETVRITTTSDGIEIFVWDMSEKQAFLLLNRLKITLAFIHA